MDNVRLSLLGRSKYKTKKHVLVGLEQFFQSRTPLLTNTLPYEEIANEMLVIPERFNKETKNLIVLDILEFSFRYQKLFACLLVLISKLMVTYPPSQHNLILSTPSNSREKGNINALL